MSNFYKLINEKKKSEIKKISKEDVSLEMLQAVCDLMKEVGMDMVDKKFGFKFEDFVDGFKVESEHGNHDKSTDTIPDVHGHDNPVSIAKITMAHHKEDKDYYPKLKKMED